MSHAISDTTYPVAAPVDVRLYDDPGTYQDSVRVDANNYYAELLLRGVSCSGCTHKIESTLRKMPGVKQADVNFAARRLGVYWNGGETSLGALIKTIRSLGYDAIPWSPTTARRQIDVERKDQMKRLGVAGVFGMQVMTIAVAQYFDVLSNMDEGLRLFMIRFSLLLTLPVVLYSAAPIFRSALKLIKSRQFSMDLSVALAISLAFAGSIIPAVTGSGDTYFESICMFVFLLTATRLVEINARHRASQSVDLIASSEPEYAWRVDKAGDSADRPTSALSLAAGDIVMVKTGDTVPADATVIKGQSLVSEALISGESEPLHRQSGDRVIAGSTNISAPLWLRVTMPASKSTLSRIRQLAERSHQHKPTRSPFDSQITRFFMVAVIITASATALGWYLVDPQQLLPATIAVLTVACPCAISLASPAAIAAASNNLLGKRILLTSNCVMDQFSRITDVIFDKTGTLTQPELVLSDVTLVNTNATRELSLATAATLDMGINHPIAMALVDAAKRENTPRLIAQKIIAHTGYGVSGQLDGVNWHLGNPQYLSRHLNHDTIQHAASMYGEHRVWIARAQQVIAGFNFQEQVRPDAAQVVNTLAAHGVRTHLLSGDQQPKVDQMTKSLNISQSQASASPSSKRRYIESLQQAGKVVAMVGDGANDSPAFAQANVSVSVDRAANLAINNADIVLLTDNLTNLLDAFELSLKTDSIIRQNQIWALSYNLVCIPLAAFGLIPPWLAALGMSFSSVAVLSNSMRLNSDRKPRIETVN